MKKEIIALIKKYQAKRRDLQEPDRTYSCWTTRSAAITYGECIGDLKELLQPNKKISKDE